MLATVLYAPGDIRVEDVPDPRIEQATDAIVQVELSAICGTDLGGFRGVDPVTPGQRMGHEFIGVVTDTGSAVQTLKKGDQVVAPLRWSDGTCRFCRGGLPTSCVRGGDWGTQGADAGQGEAVRVPWADGTLVRLPEWLDPAVLPGILTLSDVLPAGLHAVQTARVGRESTIAIIGDGSVGLCSVLAAESLGAERIILVGRYEDRLSVARKFGATDIVVARDQEAIAAVRELTPDGLGADAVVDSFGSEQSIATAVGIARDGAMVSLVGVTHQATWLDVNEMINRNLTFRAGIAPSRAYIDQLLPKVISGELDPTAIFDRDMPLRDVPEGYAAMADRTAIKVLIRQNWLTIRYRKLAGMGS